LTGVTYSVELVRRLVGAYPQHMFGLKDSSGDLSYARAIAAIDPRLAVFPSSEASLKEARSGVFAGCISATANLTAALCAEAFHKQDDRALAKAVALRDAFSGVPLVPAVKSIMAHVHGSSRLENVKPPLVPLEREARMRLVAEVERILHADLGSPRRTRPS
jgi:4-hydroxy-tetrahydrodipicolinate synthase